MPTPADALEIMEAPLLRWLYARRRPNQSFKIAFDQEIQRLYDEWDALAAQGRRRHRVPPADAAALRARGRHRRRRAAAAPRARCRTARSPPSSTSPPATEEQTLRILRDLDPADPITSLDEVRPRLDRAEHWVTTQVPAEQRTRVRDEPGRRAARRRSTTPSASRCGCCWTGWTTHWSLDGLTTLVYGVPKVQAGLPPDAKPTAELKAAQRAFFALLYHLLVGRDTGPRLPTLLLAVGADRVRAAPDPAGVARGGPARARRPPWSTARRTSSGASPPSAHALVVVAVSQLAGLALVLALAAPSGGSAGPADLAWGLPAPALPARSR